MVHRKGSGPNLTTANLENIAAVAKLVKEDKRITYTMIKIKIDSSQVRSIFPSFTFGEGCNSVYTPSCDIFTKSRTC